MVLRASDLRILAMLLSPPPFMLPAKAGFEGGLRRVRIGYFQFYIYRFRLILRVFEGSDRYLPGPARSRKITVFEAPWKPKNVTFLPLFYRQQGDQKVFWTNLCQKCVILVLFP